MGLVTWIGRPSRAVALVAVGAAGAGAAIAVASVPDTGGVIHACYALDAGGAGQPALGANVRIIDPSAGQACSTAGPASPGEQTVSWNTVGQQGVQGVAGATGAQGPQGAEGHTLTINGQTFSISGLNQAGTIEGVPLVAPLAPDAKGRPVGTLSLDSGRGPRQSIDILSWSFGATQAGSGLGSGGGGAGKVKFNEFTIKKTTDKASPLFFKNCASGAHYKTVTLSLRKAGGESTPFVSLTLTGAVCTSYQQSSGGDRPIESLSFSFAKASYDLKKATK